MFILLQSCFSMPPHSLYGGKIEEFNGKAEKMKKKTPNADLFHPQQMSIVFSILKQQHLRSSVVLFCGPEGSFL